MLDDLINTIKILECSICCMSILNPWKHQSTKTSSISFKAQQASIVINSSEYSTTDLDPCFKSWKFQRKSRVFDHEELLFQKVLHFNPCLNMIYVVSFSFATWPTILLYNCEIECHPDDFMPSVIGLCAKIFSTHTNQSINSSPFNLPSYSGINSLIPKSRSILFAGWSRWFWIFPPSPQYFLHHTNHSINSSRFNLPSYSGITSLIPKSRSILLAGWSCWFRIFPLSPQ